MVFNLCFQSIGPLGLSISRNVRLSVRLSVCPSVRLSVCPSVRLSVCPSVCPSVCSLLRYHLTVFLPPLPEVGCPIFLEIQNPWGKVMERSGLAFEHFCLEVLYEGLSPKFCACSGLFKISFYFVQKLGTVHQTADSCTPSDS